MKPICLKCKKFFVPSKNGIRFTEGMPVDDHWKPYKLWLGDAWKCSSCDAEIIVGVGREPVSEHHEPEFEKILSMGFDQVQINDC